MVSLVQAIRNDIRMLMPSQLFVLQYYRMIPCRVRRMNITRKHARCGTYGGLISTITSCYCKIPKIYPNYMSREFMCWYPHPLQYGRGEVEFPALTLRIETPEVFGDELTPKSIQSHVLLGVLYFRHILKYARVL